MRAEIGERIHLVLGPNDETFRCLADMRDQVVHTGLGVVDRLLNPMFQERDFLRDRGARLHDLPHVLLDIPVIHVLSPSRWNGVSDSCARNAGYIGLWTFCRSHHVMLFKCIIRCERHGITATVAKLQPELIITELSAVPALIG